MTMIVYDTADDAIADMFRCNDIDQIELRRMAPVQWDETHKSRTAQPEITHSFLGDGRRYARGNGGLGPYKPDGRERRGGATTFFMRGSNLTKTKPKRLGIITTRIDNHRKVKVGRQDDPGVATFKHNRNDDVIVMYHVDRLIAANADIGLSRERIIRDAKRMTYEEVGVWDIETVKSRRVVDRSPGN